MSEMIKRVARAMREEIERQMAAQTGYCEDTPGEPGMVTVDGDVDMSTAARAAIAAMHEPTVEMVRAATVDPLGKYVTPNHAALAWQLMIDQALRPDET